MILVKIGFMIHYTSNSGLQLVVVSGWEVGRRPTPVPRKAGNRQQPALTKKKSENNNNKSNQKYYYITCLTNKQKTSTSENKLFFTFFKLLFTFFNATFLQHPFLLKKITKKFDLKKLSQSLSYIFKHKVYTKSHKGE